MRLRFWAIWLFGLLLICASLVTAQAPVTLLVDGQSGTVKTGDVCPNNPASVNYLTIQAAVTCSSEGAIIVIQAGTYPELLQIDKNLTIEGSGANNTFIQGDGSDRLVTLAVGIDVNLSNITLSGGQAEQGGGLYASDANIVLDRVIFTGNTAVTGGGIYLGKGSLTLTNSTLSANNASGSYGAGIYADDATINLDNTIVTGNFLSAETCSNTLFGAGLYLHAGKAVITESTFNGNTALNSACTVEGTGVYTAEGTITITSSVMSDSVVQVIQSVSSDIVAPTLVPDGSTSTSTNTDTQLDSPDIALRWMEQVLEAVRLEKLNPPRASRIYASAGITLYESLVPWLDGYQSLSGHLNNMPAMPQPEAGLVYDPQSVANAAMAKALDKLFKEKSETTTNNLNTLYDKINFERGEVVPLNVFNRSITLGEQIGTAVVDWIYSDNFDVTRQMTYMLPLSMPNLWVPLDGQKALEPYWGTLRPLALPLASVCDIEPTIPFSDAPDSAFYKQADEVRTTVMKLTPDERAIALFWADAADTPTPPGHWISILNQIVKLRHLTLAKAAQAYALTGIALGDAFIAAWEVKYRVQLIRPITYIQRYIDPNWSTVMITPPFPEYPSGHSVSSGAASTILTALLGDGDFSDNTHALHNLPARSFSSFGQAAEEAAMSRMYGGIHYRDAIENGLKQGRCIGQIVLDRLIVK